MPYTYPSGRVRPEGRNTPHQGPLPGQAPQPKKESPRRKPRSFWRKGKLFFLGLVLLGLVAFSAFVFSKYLQNDLVAIVDKDTITEQEFQAEVDEYRELLGKKARKLGATKTQFEDFFDTNRSILRQKVLTSMISRMLVLEAARQEGIQVSEAVVSSEFKRQVDALPREVTLQERLQELGKTALEVKSEMKDQLVIETYIKKYSPVETSVSQSEVRGLYRELATRYDTKTASGTPVSLPSFGSIEERLRAELLNRKKMLAAGGVLSLLQARAKVLVFPDDLAYPPRPEQTPKAGKSSPGGV